MRGGQCPCAIWTTSLKAFGESSRGEEFVAFFEPPSLDERITNQYAVFSLPSSARLDFSAWLEARPVLARKLIVRADLKWEIRDKLDQANVTERVLFPGLDGLSRWLGRQYMKPEDVHLRAQDDAWSRQCDFGQQRRHCDFRNG